jgi:heme-degrading monooxygenase HmoA
MVTIQAGNSVVTLINVFTVESENQQKLVDMLVEASEKVIKNVPGFISANIHKSADGVRVTNYAQWRSEEDYAAMLKDPKAVEHMKPVTEIAIFDAHTYEVVESVSVT